MIYFLSQMESEGQLMDVMLIFDMVIAGLGLYLVYSAVKMKNTGEISTIIVNQEEMARCKNKKGFVEAMSQASIYFGAVALAYGVLAIINDVFTVLGKYFNIIGAVVFIGSWLWFSAKMQKAREEFFY